jgi:hypothetical protein
MLLPNTLRSALDPRRPRPLPLSRSVALGLLLLGLHALPALAVSVSPAALYLDSRTRSGVLTLTNVGSLPEEIEIGFAFGYPTSNDAGNVTLDLVPEAPAGEPSLLPWLRAFPRRVRLEPGQHQVVRIIVQPPPNLAAGEYWGRITVLSRGGRPPIEQEQNGVHMKIDLQTQVIAAVTYRTGSVSTGAQVTAAHLELDSARTPRAVFDLARTGNAAFLGRVHVEIVAPDGQVVDDATEDVAVYHTLRRVIALQKPLPANPAGYRVRFTVSAERPDLPPEGPLPAPTLTGTVPLP